MFNENRQINKSHILDIYRLPWTQVPTAKTIPGGDKNLGWEIRIIKHPDVVTVEWG
jgi:hypothetical protein